MDGSWNSEHFATLLESIARGDQRTTLERRLHYQASAGQPADQPVAPRKIGGKRGRTQCEFGYQGAFLGKPMCQIAIACRVNDIQAGTDYGDRRRQCGESAGVRGGIDAKSQATDDGKSTVG